MNRYVMAAMPYLVIFLSIMLVSLPAHCWKPWGVVTLDGSEIQVFWNSGIEDKDYRIPQDMKLLETDDFQIFVRSKALFEGKNESIRIEVYGAVTYFENSTDNAGNVTGEYAERTSYELLLSAKNFTLTSGTAEAYNDKRFAVKIIDRESFPEFTQANETQQIRVIYKELTILFEHRTNIIEIEVVKTLGSWNMEMLAFISLSFVIFIIPAIFISFLIHLRLGVAPNPPPWYVWILIFTLAVMLFVMAVLLAGVPIESIGRYFLSIPPFYVPFGIGLWLIGWLTPKYQRSVETVIFITVQVIREKVKVGIFPLLSYYKNNRIELIENKNDWFETLIRFIKGGTKAPMFVQTPKVPVESLNKKIQRIVPCSQFEFQKAKFQLSTPHWSIMIPVVFEAVILYLMIAYQVHVLISFIEIIGFATFGIAILLFFTDIQQAQITAVESLHKSELSVITDINAVARAREYVTELVKRYTDDMARASADNLTFLGEGLEEYNRGYLGQKQIEVDDQVDLSKLDDETKQELIKEILEWSELEKLKNSKKKEEKKKKD